MLGRNGMPVQGIDDKIRYVAIVSFDTKALLDRFSTSKTAKVPCTALVGEP
jgi:hypothetical protein